MWVYLNLLDNLRHRVVAAGNLAIIFDSFAPVNKLLIIVQIYLDLVVVLDLYK
jgi:hypothetical protein